jgi:multiple sugar transport system permease protein
VVDSRSTSRAERRRWRSPGWYFVAPYLVVLVAFGIAPAIYGLYQAFNVTAPIGAPYFSLTKNFVDVIRDYRLPRASWNVVKYLFLWLPMLLVAVFGLALAMDAKHTRFAAVTRFVTYVPGAVTGSAAALLWLFMSSPAVSPIGPALKLFVDKSGSFLSDQNFALILAVMGTASGAGGWIVVVYGALVAIPPDIIESALLDGAGAWDIVWHIKLPIIRSYIAFILIISIAQGFQLFVEPTVISRGAGGQVSRTWSINQLVFSYATDQSNYGRAAALAILLLVVCVALAVVIITRTKFYSTGDR